MELEMITHISSIRFRKFKDLRDYKYFRHYILLENLVDRGGIEPPSSRRLFSTIPKWESNPILPFPTQNLVPAVRFELTLL